MPVAGLKTSTMASWVGRSFSALLAYIVTSLVPRLLDWREYAGFTRRYLPKKPGNIPEIRGDKHSRPFQHPLTTQENCTEHRDKYEFIFVFIQTHKFIRRSFLLQYTCRHCNGRWRGGRRRSCGGGECRGGHQRIRLGALAAGLVGGMGLLRDGGLVGLGSGGVGRQELGRGVL